MLSSLFIVNNTGGILFEKHFHGIIARTVANEWWELVLAQPDAEAVPPVLPHAKYYFISVQSKHKMWFLAVAQQEVQPLLVVEFLRRLIGVFEEYFKDTTEETLKDNFVTVYQLIDEMIDGGLPFQTELNVLRDLVTPPDAAAKLRSVMGMSNVGGALPIGATGTTFWRKSDVKYSNNECFFDLFEDVDCIVDSNGTVVAHDVRGHIQVNCRLSGMPDLTLHFVNPRLVDDISFHICVRTKRWENERVVSFVPPDGNFKLLTYRAQPANFALPLWIKPIVSYRGNSGTVNITLGSKLPTTKSKLEKLVIVIPLPKATTSTSLTPNLGKAIFDDATKVVRWDIGVLHDSPTRQPALTGSIYFPANTPMPDSRPNVRVEFHIPSHTVSGLKVDSVGVAGVKYEPFKGVRSMCRAGRFEVRV